MVKFPNPDKTMIELQSEAAAAGAILQYNSKTCRIIIADHIVAGFRPASIVIKQ